MKKLIINLTFFLTLALSAFSQTANPIDKLCPQTGEFHNSFEKRQNLLKNRYGAKIVNPSVITMAQLLAPGDDTNRFNSNQLVSLTGHLILVKDGGLEGCNCKNPNLLDYHLVLSDDPKHPENAKRHAIVEITPRYAGQFGSLDQVRAKFLGHEVTVTGLMFPDQEHANRSENTNPNSADNWRGTLWEIHPVLDIKIVDNEN